MTPPAPLRLLDTGGEGTPVLLLHGIGASSRIFEDVVARSGRAFRLLRPDLPGRSTQPLGAPLEPRALARLLIEACGLRRLDPILLVGHSFGGLIALEILRAAPQSVRGAVLASVPAQGVPGARALLGLQVVESTLKRAALLPRSRFLVQFYLRQIWGSTAPLLPRHVDGYVEALGNPSYFTSTLQALRAVASYELEASAILASGVPLRLLWGERDRLVPPASGQQLGKLLNAPLRLLPGVGHCLPEEAPEAIVEALHALLASPEHSR